MNDLYIFTLKVLRRIVKKCGLSYSLPPVQREMNPDKVSDIIYNFLVDDKPCMISRFGSVELSAIINYLGVSSDKHSVWKFMRGELPQWWWNENIIKNMQLNAGFFPPTHENLEKFCTMMLEDTEYLDVLGSWVDDEILLFDYIIHTIYVHLRLLEPFWSSKPWSRALAGKRVVVVHPFAELIEKQYREHRTELFDNEDVLPKFSLRVVKAVQSIAGNNCEFNDWFEALDSMKKSIDNEPYDIALIGCGAYGFPLAAHVKRTGHKAIHLGGALQLLFGIKGKRWEDPNYGVKEWGIPYGIYSSLINEYWVRPSDNFKPKNAQSVEGACYW